MNVEAIFRMYFPHMGEPNASGEIAVCCPFPHKTAEGVEYYEKVPSAHINLAKGTFHCKVCRGLGRFNNGGLSAIDFYAKMNGLSYIEAVHIISNLSMADNRKKLIWEENMKNLRESPEMMKKLKELGITEQTAELLQLGYVGDGIQFPVFVHGELLDIRTYDPEATPKIRSEKGAKPLIFPFDLWIKDDRPTLLCEGEKDTAIARQMGFNAITFTGGAGTFPKLFKNYFKGREVWIVYDCDDAGRQGARAVAFYLYGTASSIKVVDLGLAAKEDVHDFFIKYNRTAEELFQIIQQTPNFSLEDAQAEKNKHYPLVDLWDVSKGKYTGKELSSRVIMSGKYDYPMQAPVAVEWSCTRYNPDNNTCLTCPFRMRNPSGQAFWTLTEENSDAVLKLVDSGLKENQVNKNLRQMVGIPDNCPGHRKEVKAYQSVKKVIVTPDIESNVKDDPLAEFKSEEIIAYVLEQEHVDMVDGGRYRIYFKRYPHPLQAQKIVLVVHNVEDSDNPVNMFRMTTEVKDGLQVFQGEPKEKMLELAERAKDIIGSHAQPMLVWATDLVYHSPLQFYFGGKLIPKGYPEGMIIGESRTGKTDVATSLQRWYGIGSYTDSKNASVAGFVGGADKLPSGGHKIRWGIIPKNNKGLLIIDEFSGLPVEVMSKLTSVRSSQIARIEKIASGAAPAFTRLLWISNPRAQSNGQSLPLFMYPSGIEVLLELVGTDEDIARFDFAMLVATPETYNSPLETVELKAYDRELYRQLIYWVWSRKPEQIVWEEGAEQLIVDRGKLINAKYPSNVKIFGAEAWKKIARLAVATACRLFSCDESGENVIVRKSHVDFACRFLVDCYDNDIFRLNQYIQSKKPYMVVDENSIKVVGTLSRQHPNLIRLLMYSTETSFRQMQAVSGLEKKEFDSVASRLSEYYLIQIVGEKVQPSFKFRKCVEILRKQQDKTYLKPLGTGGGLA